MTASPPTTGDEFVDLWYCATDTLTTPEIGAAVAALSPEERARHDRLARDGDKRDFAVAHALVRWALSNRTGRSPESWRFQSSSRGKPALLAGDPSRLSFSLSHTDGMVACAVGVGADIGVDVEPLRSDRCSMDIAERYFAAPEVAALRDLSAPERERRFVELWVLKEALAKALGVGVHHHLADPAFEFSVEARLSFTLSGSAEASGWHLELFAPTLRHRMAVALRPSLGSGARVVLTRSRCDRDARLLPIRTSVASGVNLNPLAH
jgi:4'-phosphopantetheinyl transferase